MWDSYAGNLEQLSEDITTPVDGSQTPPNYGTYSASEVIELFKGLLPGGFMTSLRVPMHVLATDPAAPEKALRNVLLEKYLPVLSIFQSRLGFSLPAAAVVLGRIIDGEGRYSIRSLDV
jgi:hypothetical protein